MRPGGSTRPRMEKPVMVLPLPDSPTRPSTSPLPTRNDTPSTAFTTPSRVKKCVARSLTSKVGAVIASTPHRLRRGFRTSRSRRSEEHTSELQSLMRISYAVFCLKKKSSDDIDIPYSRHPHDSGHNQYPVAAGSPTVSYLT